MSNKTHQGYFPKAADGLGENRERRHYTLKKFGIFSHQLLGDEKLMAKYTEVELELEKEL